MHNPPALSALDGLGSGLGYSLILILVGTIRELFGSGTLLGVTIMTTVHDGGWFTPLNLMLLAPSAFFILGLLIWTIRTFKPEQVEAEDFSIHADQEGRTS